MTNVLFNEECLNDVFSDQGHDMVDEINSLDENRILNNSEEDLCNYFVEKYKVEAPQIDEEQIKTDYADVQTTVEDNGYIDLVTGTRVTFYIPIRDGRGSFDLRPSQYDSNPPCADVRENDIVMTYEQATHDVSQFKGPFESDLACLKKYLKWVEQDITSFNSAIREIASQEIKDRREKILKDRELVEKIGYPLRRRQDTPDTYIASQVKRVITPKLPPVSTAPYKSKHELDIKEYEHILSIVSNMVMVMECSPKAFRDMKEEILRQHFLVQLNGQYEGQATGETFNFNGKTDILIRVKGKNIFIAECKFWKGPKAFKESIDQLLNYSTWRDTKTALLVFNRDTKMSTVLKKIPEVVKDHPNYKTSRDYDSETGFRYILRHRDDANREIVLTVLVFNIPA